MRGGGRVSCHFSSPIPFSPEQDDIINLRSQQQSTHEDTRSILKQMEVSWVPRGRDGEPLEPVCQVACPNCRTLSLGSIYCKDESLFRGSHPSPGAAIPSRHISASVSPFVSSLDQLHHFFTSDSDHKPTSSILSFPSSLPSSVLRIKLRASFTLAPV